MMPSGNSPATSRQNLKAIRILFGALAGGVLIFNIAMVGLLLAAGPSMKQADVSFKNILMWVAFGVAAIALYFASNSYKKGMQQIKNLTSSLDDKLNRYRSTLILYLALCEGPALLAATLLFLTGNYLLLIISAVMLLAMLARAPLLKRLVDELGLDWNQQQELV
jgi:hypothetical protein